MNDPASANDSAAATPARLVDLLGWTPRDSDPLPTPASTASGDTGRGARSLRRANHARRARLLLAFTGASAAAGVLVASLALPVVAPLGLATREAAAYWNALPDALPVMPLPQRSTILAADGSQIAQFYSENRVNVPLDQVPLVLRDAVLSTEDSRFYDHSGVDIRGTARALVNNLTGGAAQGGSTLTQQYVKNVLLQTATTADEREQVAGHSYLRKVKEAKLALVAEHTLSKDQILEGYLNIAYFGDGAYGVGTASQHYFAKPVSDLTLPEAAVLAGLLKNPVGYDPTNHPQAATERRNIVLGRMLATGAITQESHDTAVAAPLTLTVTNPANGCATSRYPFYCEWVKQTLRTDPVFGATAAAREDRLYRGGMTIHTALDPAAQDAAQAAVSAAIPASSRVATAAVTVTPGTGAVTAMAVNRGFGSGEGQTEVLLPVLPAYQPGSTMKPITLAAAFEQGFSPATVIDAPNRYSPAGMSAPEGGFGNAGDSEAGQYDAAQATWRSVNTWYIKVEEKVGVLPVADMAARLGITSLPRDGERAITARDASLTLGAYEVSPLEMAGVYAAFAAHGTACKPTGITSITGPDGKPVTTPDPGCHQAVSPGIADTVTSILRGTIDGPDPLRTGAGLSLGRPAAGKSGTTNNSAAAWFVGYTPQAATAVWVGDPRGGPGHPLRNIRANGRSYAAAYGGTVAGPIWQNVMRAQHAHLPVQDFAAVDPSVLAGISRSVPDVRGLERDQAIQVLTDAGYAVSIEAAPAASDGLIPPGRVVTATVAATPTASAPVTVTLTLSAGSDTHVRAPAPASAARPAAPGADAPPSDGTVRDSGNGILTGP